MLETYARDGWAVVDDLVEPAEVAWLVEVVDRLVDEAVRENAPGFQDLTRPFGKVQDGPPAVPQVMAPHELAPELLDGRYLARAAEVGRECLGAEAVTSIAMVIAKPPHSPGVVPWHQDAAYWGHAVRVAGASIWIPLQDVDEHNGCLSFVTGSHLGEVRPHQRLGGNEDVHALELVPDVVDVETRAAVAVHLRAGQASVHDGHTIHQSGPNDSDAPRRALVLSVRNPARDVPTPQRPAFGWVSP